MKKLLMLFLLLLPLSSFSQGKHSKAGKKLFALASEAYAGGNTDEAESLFKECLKEDYNFAEAHLNLSIIYYHRGEFAISMNYARHANNFSRFQPEIYEQLGKGCFREAKYDSAAYFLNKAIEFGGANQEINLYLGQSLMQVGDYRGSIDFLSKVIASNLNSSAAYSDRGSAYYNIEEFDKAQADFDKALNLNSGGAEIYLNLATLALKEDSLDVSMKYLQKAEVTAKSKSEKVQVLILQGGHYLKEGDWEKAEATFNDAFLIDQSDPVILTNQAVVAIHKDDFQTAWEKCNLALEIDGEMMAAYLNRGIANEMLRRTADACLDWEQAFILGSERAEKYLNSPICNE
ncbi:tetratricopeptide repeat protein [Crocinitomix catalasitica]|nr:tetratricopeptide repeat protein [Crocinitomix catalasitica]